MECPSFDTVQVLVYSDGRWHRAEAATAVLQSGRPDFFSRRSSQHAFLVTSVSGHAFQFDRLVMEHVPTEMILGLYVSGFEEIRQALVEESE